MREGPSDRRLLVLRARASFTVPEASKPLDTGRHQEVRLPSFYL